MKFNYAVKYKGVFYPTGADVPVEETTKDIKETKEVADDTARDVKEESKKAVEPTKDAKAEPKKSTKK